MTWANRPTNFAGKFASAAALEATYDQIDALTAPGWTSYASTFAWTSTGTPPALGTSTVTAAYRRSTDSDLVIVEFAITFAGATFGTGSYRFSLPVAASAGAILRTVGTAWLLDSGTTTRPASTQFISSTTLSITSVTGEVTSAVPWTWANGDQIRCSLQYEPA